MAKDNNQPTLEEWKKLYKLAAKFEKLAPWEWMCDVDVFGIMDPRTKEIAYCSIMGNNREFYGMGVYVGAAGFASLDLIARGEIPDGIDDKINTQKCLLVEYGKRDRITKEEMEIIKKTGVRFERRNFWPMFKDYTPGYYPWTISGSDVEFLITVVEQAIDVVSDFKNNKDKLIARVPEQFLVKTPAEKNGKISWHYKYSAPEKYIENEKIPALSEPDEILARNMKKEMEPDDRVEWEFDYFRAREPIQDDKKLSRPYYPYILFAVDRISGMIINISLSDPGDGRFRIFRKCFIEAVQKSNILPGTLLIRKYDLAEIMKPIADVFGIKIKISNDLRMFDEAKNSFIYGDSPVK